MREFINIVEGASLGGPLSESVEELVQVLRQHGLEQIEPVPEKWLVHFSSDADDICAQGFTRGTPLDHTDWNMSSGRDYNVPGYNFAVDAADEGSLSFWADNAPSAVVFRASGVRTYHYDGFYQIIFDGKDVKRPMYLIEWANDGGYANVIEEAEFMISAKDGKPFENPFTGSLYDVLDAIESGAL